MAATILHFPSLNANGNRTESPTPPSHLGAPILRVVDGIVDPKVTFILAFNEAMIATAERNLVEERWAAAHRLGDSGALSSEREAAHTRQLTAAVRLAETPAMTKQQIRMKKRGIGHVWLHAEGDFYEPFRQAVARDEARLAGSAA